MLEINDIFSIQNDSDFERVALQVFEFQKDNCSVYREYLQLIGRENPKTIDEIAFLPIQFFKTRKVLSVPENENQLLFLSSGTGFVGRSHHYIHDVSLYEHSFRTCYEQFFGSPENQVILALLPNYIAQGNSSLVYMVKQLIEDTHNEHSGFLMHDMKELHSRYEEAILAGKSVVIFGVSYALMDLAECNFDFSKAIVIETGGMKGRREELTKSQLHQLLKSGLNVAQIYSEYGMTELLSQAYSTHNEEFTCPNWLRISFADVNDPLTIVDGKKRSIINVMDLANIYSCSFIQTQDVGQRTENGFRLLGRLDVSDVRGCNLMYPFG